MDYRKSAQDVLDNIGGASNVVSAAHCATRLRLVIADNSKVNKAAIENVDGVKGCFEASGQLQVIFGTGTVNKVYDEFISIGHLKEGTKRDVKDAAAAKQNIFLRAIKTLGDIFVPIIPAIVASGLLTGILGGLSNAIPSIAQSDTYAIINMLASAALSMLPILIAISAAKKFGGNQFLAGVIGFVMINPSLINAWSVAGLLESGEKISQWSVWFGAYKIDQVGYQGHVIPVIIAIWFMSWIEKKLHKIVPEMLDLFVTPLVTVLTTGYLTMSVIGPVFSKVEGYVLDGAHALITLPYGLGGIIIGGLYAFTVVAGLHHMYNMIEAEMCSLATPMNTWMPIATAANVGLGAAALAVGVKTKNKKIKAMALPASMSAFLGITEPAIFGVNVRFGKPFIAGCVGGAAGGFVAALSGIYASAYGITGLFGYLITTKFVVAYSFVMLVSFVAAFVTSWILYKDAPMETAVVDGNKDNTGLTEKNNDTAAVTVNDSYDLTEKAAVNDNTVEIITPIAGKIIDISDVEDEVMSSKALGDGMAVVPSDGKVYAPCDGEVSTLFVTKHAIGITTENNVDILIHIGLNTVELDGKHFEAKVSEGDKVKKGDLLLEFDKDAILAAGYKLTTPVIVTNFDETMKLEKGDMTDRQAKEPMFRIIKM